MTRISHNTKFVVGGSLAALVLVGCGTASADTEVAASTPTPTASQEPEAAPEPEPESAGLDCDALGDEAIELSERSADDDPFSSQILSLYDVEPVEDNIDAYLADTFTFDGNSGTILACEGDATWTTGGDTGIRMEWTVDVNGEEFIGYEGLAASSDDPITLPGVSTSVGQAYDNYGYTYVPVTVTNDGDSVLDSAWVTVRGENETTVFDDGIMMAENLKPGQSYTEDVQIGEGVPLDATFTVISVENL